MTLYRSFTLTGHIGKWTEFMTLYRSFTLTGHIGKLTQDNVRILELCIIRTLYRGAGIQNEGSNRKSQDLEPYEDPRTITL